MRSEISTICSIRLRAICFTCPQRYRQKSSAGSSWCPPRLQPQRPIGIPGARSRSAAVRRGRGALTLNSLWNSGRLESNKFCWYQSVCDDIGAESLKSIMQTFIRYISTFYTKEVTQRGFLKLVGRILGWQSKWKSCSKPGTDVDTHFQQQFGRFSDLVRNKIELWKSLVSWVSECMLYVTIEDQLV